MRRLPCFVTAFLCGWAHSGPVFASPDSATAQALFDEARALMDAGRIEAACPKLEESQHLDPGIGTQFRLGDCYERSGRIASAWVQFLEVASLARGSQQLDRAEAAEVRARRLEPRLPRLKVVVADEHRVEGLQVERDGMTVNTVSWGTSIPVDAGAHTIVVRAPGHLTHTEIVRVSEGEMIVWAVPAMVRELAEQGAVEQGAVEQGAVEQPTPPPKQVTLAPQLPASTDHTLVYALAGVGVVGLAVSGAFSMMALSVRDESLDQCRPNAPNQCTDLGKSLRDEAIIDGHVATVAVAVGGAALVGAGVVWWFYDSDDASGVQARASTSPSYAGVQLEGAF